MCYSCHLGLTDKNINEQLLDALNKKTYNKWNTTTVSHILLTASGMNGDINRELALTLLEEFINYVKLQPNEYISETGVEKMYNKNKLENVFKYVKLTKDTNIENIFMHLQ